METSFSKEYADEHIDEFYNRITKEMQDSTLFGEPVDINNPKHVAIACFYMGQEYAHRWQNQDNEIKHMFNVLNKPKNLLGF